MLGLLGKCVYFLNHLTSIILVTSLLMCRATMTKTIYMRSHIIGSLPTVLEGVSMIITVGNIGGGQQAWIRDSS